MPTPFEDGGASCVSGQPSKESKRPAGSPTGGEHAEIPSGLDRLVLGIAGRLHARLPRGCGIDMADLVQAGNVGLLKASRAFEPSSGVPLAGYAKFRIRGEMLDMIRQHASRPLVQYSGAEIHEEAGSPDWIAQAPAPPEASPHCAAIRNQTCTILREEIRRLPMRYRRLVTMRYSSELTLREIGAELNVKESRVSQIHQLALTRLRRALSTRGVRGISNVL